MQWENLIGKNIKKEYHLNQLLGKGNYGAAYRAIRISNREEVAVKVQYPTVLPERGYEFVDQAAQFFREPLLLEAVLKEHQHIIPIKEKGIDIEKGLFFYVMPVAEGGSLRRCVSEERPLPARLIIRFISQTAEGLQFAHNQRVIHQDVKPENLLLHRNTEAQHLDIWITDFGLATAAHAITSLPKDNPSVGGSPGYLAPEQIKGQAMIESDQYALAIVTYELLSGKRPFTGKQYHEIVYKQLNDPPPTFFEQGVQMTPVLEALQEVIMQALAKDPMARYQSITIFANRLQEAHVKAAEEQEKQKKIFDMGSEESTYIDQKFYEEVALADDEAITLPPTANPIQAVQNKEQGKLQNQLDEHHRELKQRDEADKALKDHLSQMEREKRELVQALEGSNKASSWLQSLKKEALQTVERALRIFYPKDYFAWLHKGFAMRELGRQEEALAAFDQALRINPKGSMAWSNKGIVLSDLGRQEEALAAYDQALRINPKSSEAYTGKGIVLSDLGRQEEALAAYDQVLRINPKDYFAWLDKGFVLRELGRQEEALAAYDQVLRINPKSSEAYTGKGAVLSELGRQEEALAAFDQALRINPKGGMAWSNKGFVLSELGRQEEALKACDQALRINPKHGMAWTNKGVVLSELGRQEEALAAFDQVLRINPKFSEAYARKGGLLCFQGKYQEGVACLQQALDNNPSEDVRQYIAEEKKKYHLS